MKTIEHAGLVWEVHSPSLFVHAHDGSVDILVGCNGRTWQIGINDTYRDRQFFTRNQAMEAYAKGLADARRAAAGYHVSELGN
jgi:hypothetical protein